MEALENAYTEHWALSDYHGELAGTFATLGRHVEARNQYQLAVAIQCKQDGDDMTVAVTLARFFLAGHCLQLNEPLIALEAIVPSLPNGFHGDWLLQLVKAKALYVLG